MTEVRKCRCWRCKHNVERKDEKGNSVADINGVCSKENILIDEYGKCYDKWIRDALG